jgi:type IV pilus assembly protein PilB
MSATEAHYEGLADAESSEARRLADEVGLDFVDLDLYPVNASATSLIPERLARSHDAIAVGWRYGTPVVAVARPDDVMAMDDLRSVIGREVHAVVATRSQIASYLSRLYQPGQPPPGVVVPLTPREEESGGDEEPAQLSNDQPGEEEGEPALSKDELTSFDEPFGPEGAGSQERGPDLAEMLVSSGQVTQHEMEAALREQAATGERLGDILVGLGLVSEEGLTRAMAAELGLEFLDLNAWTIDPGTAAMLPEALARRHQVLPVGYRGERPLIALANPADVFALDDLKSLLGSDIATVLAPSSQVSEYISRLYRRDEETEAAAKSALSQSGPGLESVSLTDLNAAVEDAPIVKYVNLILRQALQERASDIHIEPAADDFRVRFRIDGVLHDITRSPKAIQGGVTTRLKVMADLDIAEHRLPQDGRITITAGKREIDLRVATLPTVHGEKVVMRVLDKTNASLDLAELGFLPAVKARYEKAFRKPYGTILVTGPTGSGKSTTLYATLNALNSTERNLITVEDPVEYQLPGINQVQVNPKAGLTFANTLRSILRSDPDVILVGEVRDRETAVIAIEAALTGHLVLTTLHTNDAAGTPMRLIEMGVEPFLVGSAIDCVVAQRLARQLCDNCSESYEPSEEELAASGWEPGDAPVGGPARFRRAVGCQACSRTGYRGRMALHELLPITEEIERAVIAGLSVDQIARLGVEQGMVPLRHDGLRKAALGLTSLEEVLRVVA